MDRQCSSCGGFCKKSGCERENVATDDTSTKRVDKTGENVHEPVQTTPNFAQLKQILDNLDRCHHRDSKQEFLRTWIRDWTEHKLTKHTTPPPRKPLTDEQIDEIYFKSSLEVDNRCEDIYDFVRAIEAAHNIKE